MDILSVELYSTFKEELFLFIIVAIFVIPLTYLLRYATEIKWLKTTLNVFFWVHLLTYIYIGATVGERAKEIETIEAIVYDWNEIMNNEEYEILERDGNWVKLEREINK